MPTAKFVTGGRRLGLHPDTLRPLSAPAVSAQAGFYDYRMKVEMRYSLGFFRPCRALPFGHAGAYGAPGAGGAFAYADPEAGLAYAYVTSRMGTDLSGYPRDVALRAALPVE